MISKDSFVEIMDGLENYWKKFRKFEDTLGIQIDQNFMTDIFDCVMNALGADTDDDIGDEIGPLLYYYAFECDWGIGLNARKGIKRPGEIDPAPLTSAAELYDYLKERKYENDC